MAEAVGVGVRVTVRLGEGVRLCVGEGVGVDAGPTERQAVNNKQRIKIIAYLFMLLMIPPTPPKAKGKVISSQAIFSRFSSQSV